MTHRAARIGLLTPAALIGGAALAIAAHRPGLAGAAGPGFWLAAFLVWLAATLAARDLAALEPGTAAGRRLVRLAVPLLFGVLVLVLWEVVVVGAGVPAVLMPPPSAIAARFATALPVLGADFVQTCLKSALPGYVIGCLSGLGVAILADRLPVLGRGLLPVANVASALPIVGIAPIMVMWFGFDWPSKAAVVAVMTFFPMLVQAGAGLAATGSIERDLMRTYAAGYARTLLSLRLPMALPFLFTALKVNATLALIGAIVAEFFGTPIVGMGFRISIEAARLSLDMVWAEIALAALAGSAFYGLIALAERAATGWHPSVRAG
ncbi:ATP-binding protein of ABC family transporter [Methylorubrum extorquens]|uniref:ATP-binding protein of ABC family transporter n=1 Tax=Methylorubrum extorquens TaxID=408 RepID=A0A2N9AU80_METEX|nr:ABC transporter permease [Methylobacterium sp. Leaf121]SOR30848.1 ATP-binding protein of ABC family transporter [Methylorubrum extorquens]